MPSGLSTKVKEIVTRDGNLEAAFTGDSVTLTMEDEIDISRGDMIVRKNNVPTIRNNFEAYLCWMNEKSLEPGKQYLIQQTTQTAKVFIDDILYRINVDSLSREDTNKLDLNEIGRVKIQASKPIFFDPYQINQRTGSFIIIDPATNVTVGAGMIRAGSTTEGSDKKVSIRQKSPNVVWEPWNIPREEREERNGHKAKLLWFTGISGSGKVPSQKLLKRSCGTMERKRCY